jgi:hypothetical protein
MGCSGGFSYLLYPGDSVGVRELVADPFAIVDAGDCDEFVSVQIELANLRQHAVQPRIAIRVVGFGGVDDTKIDVFLQLLKRTRWYRIASVNSQRFGSIKRYALSLKVMSNFSILGECNDIELLAGVTFGIHGK